jgi:anti-sigma regulatory factor (Ser/Thr protein kinase)
MPHNRQNVKDVIRELLHDRGEVSSADVQVAAGVTRQAAHYHLRSMLEAGEIELVGRGRSARYQLPQRRTIRRPLRGLEEHVLWSEVLRSDPRLQALGDNAISILRYAFTEMVNNAIEHSRGSAVEVSQFWTDGRVVFEVADDGVGAFQTIKEKLGLDDEFAAVQELSKGKTTTDPERHTGEGIFFTSKVVDRCVLESGGARWIVDNRIGDQAVGDAPAGRGTVVRWDLDAATTRTLDEVFGAYTDPDTLAFSHSRATVRLFESGDSFVSRSEAKRLSRGLERFREVIVDFAGVREVGQGFVDELFRVWAREHPETRLVPMNMSPNVEAMVRRGLPPRLEVFP